MSADSGPDGHRGGNASLDGFPLSTAQRGIWFAQHLLGDVPLTIAQYLDVHGEFDPEIFADAGAE
ncbi:MAG: hypothetical protein GX542_04150, partial [Rhodococcus sp.]|nr:hypothetical protein [Rhodococcus sp. (in: high G+C Gram-positive bacteria)]